MNSRCINSKKNRIKLVIWMIILLLYTTGCQKKISTEQIAEGKIGAEGLELPKEEGVTGDATKLMQKYGEGSYNTGNQLTDEQKTLILAFMNDYYETLATLKLNDPSAYFVDAAGKNSVLNKVSWLFMVKLREKQSVDLLMNRYEYVLTIESIETDEEGVKIRLTEDSKQNYKAYPNITSEQYGAKHYFVLQNTGNGWKIEKHFQSGTLYWTLLGEKHEDMVEDETITIDDQAVIAAIYSQMNALLEMADNNMTSRQEQAEEGGSLEYDHIYNRKAAVDYANTWIGIRNETWLDYSSVGGNCQNYASQVLLAGEIPMDIVGDEIWKWYGRTLSNKPTSTGRTSTWTGVDEFLAYASKNRGYGLVADVNVSYDTGEIGDIIILGYDENWRHTVVVSKVIKDESGNTIDYLVHSNTLDLRNFPVSAYIYTKQKLIKIYGWND